MQIKDFKQLREQVGSAEKRTVAVAAAHDPHTLEAVLKAHEEGVLDYLLVGKAQEIIEIGKDLGHEISSDCVVDSDSDEDAAKKAIGLIHSGDADFLQKGILQTATLLKAVVNKETGISQGRPMSHIALLDIPSYHKILGVTDGGMMIYPDLEAKKAIVHNAVEMFRGLGYDKPLVSAVCSVEVVNPKMPETVDAAALKEAALQGEFGACYVEGPISFDLSMSKESARIKKYGSPVVGETDIFLVPNITVGNVLVKAMAEFAGALMAGCVVGAKCPIALNSRSAAFEEKYYSLMACAQMVCK